ncbi:HEAT repeat domain-containing protein [Methanoculleus sp. FWC-SCC1]|uniref:HEAT repeat domain-containing protein n=1 Tax=Methanoculleus frigidifontis TaxID=2584085 RepID=A0ABT8MAC0_9EURY|nr:HEAT repeat domain-containing protein [Methanoculleus sp. FWC-SCC1]MDN7024883.1 HEAT repeat domain-containing protein [Methanoculleus sp. FWC-SCC1]
MPVVQELRVRKETAPPQAGRTEPTQTEEEQKVRQDVAALLDTLLHGDTYSRLQAAGALGRIGEPAVDPLVQTLTDKETKARWNVAMALARVGEPAVGSLITITTTADDQVRNAAVWALAEIGDARAVEPLTAILRGEHSECCRALTAAALLKIGDPAGVAAVGEELAAGGGAFEGLVMEAYEGT